MEQKERNELFLFDNELTPAKKTLWDLPFNYTNSDLVIIPVPWEVTVSFRTGTAKAPEAVLEASLHVDLYDDLYSTIWKRGIVMLPVLEDLKQEGIRLRLLAEPLMLECTNLRWSEKLEQARKDVNHGCAKMVDWVKSQSEDLIEKGKVPAVLGGDHSCALGLIQAVSDHVHEFGILQIDAHLDLRKSYQGFSFSHASIMFNALNCESLKKLVQVGIRDCSSKEIEMVVGNRDRVHLFEGRTLWRRRFLGASWRDLCKEIIENLPEVVYISFDIDGLDMSQCPSSGTPIPGGLMFEEALFLIDEIVASGRTIVAFDLSEVTPGTDLSDAYTGARLLYRLSCATLASQ